MTTVTPADLPIAVRRHDDTGFRAFSRKETYGVEDRKPSSAPRRHFAITR